ncbi:MAG: PqqD family protein [Deltaproteobacteria bacterium]|nr:PqqD family protein [Deltaproteobacteria bacterium]
MSRRALLRGLGGLAVVLGTGWEPRRLASRRPRLRAGLAFEVRPGAAEIEVRTAEGARLALNPTAREILEHCDGSRTVAEIAAHLSERYDEPPGRVLPEVAGAVLTLLRAGVLRT